MKDNSMCINLFLMYQHFSKIEINNPYTGVEALSNVSLDHQFSVQSWLISWYHVVSTYQSALAINLMIRNE